MTDFETVEKEIPDFERRSMNLERSLRELSSIISDYDDPEAFFSDGNYESSIKFEKIIEELKRLAFDALTQREFAETIDIGRRTLQALGVEGARNASPQSPNGAIAIAEAINWAAKTISYAFYSLKPIMIVAAANIEGVSFGLGADGAYSLGSPTIGVASFHDPGDEVGHIIVDHLKENIPKWDHEWSGVSRQEDAFELLEDLSSGKGMVEIYANLTSPKEIKEARLKYMKNSIHNRLATIGNLLQSKTNL